MLIPVYEKRSGNPVCSICKYPGVKLVRKRGLAFYTVSSTLALYFGDSCLRERLEAVQPESEKISNRWRKVSQETSVRSLYVILCAPLLQDLHCLCAHASPKLLGTDTRPEWGPVLKYSVYWYSTVWTNLGVNFCTFCRPTCKLRLM